MIRPLRVAACTVIASSALASAGTAAPAAARSRPVVRHVLVLSVDGLHQTDLAWYLRGHPKSALASLVDGGLEFTGARTPVPSDSFPGLIGQLTGGNPESTGIFYDDTWNHALLPAGTTSCAGVTPGVEVNYAEGIDRNPLALDAGQGLPGLPGSILHMTGNPTTLIDPSKLPVDPASCTPVYPHQYLHVNTVFEVARAAGLRTAWSDKHPAYEILNGPSGTGVQDLFTPEINSGAPTPSSPIDWTKDNALTMQYDGYKVASVLNEIRGFDHSGSVRVGTPAIFGMNFQTVSTAEKLPVSDGLRGGYLDDGATPGPLLRRALDFVDGQVAAMRSAINAAHLQESTVIILSAKHGQSPKNREELLRIDDGALITALDAAWQAAHPTATVPLVAFAVDDDGMLMWLNNRSDAATDFAKQFLLHHSGIGNNAAGRPVTYHAGGLKAIFAGAAAANYFGVQPGDPRAPDLFGIAQYGVVYTGGMSKIAEHGGTHAEDRDVALVVSGSALNRHGARNDGVETTQIAPTILRLLDLNPAALMAVQIEHTAALPLD